MTFDLPTPASPRRTTRVVVTLCVGASLTCGDGPAAPTEEAVVASVIIIPDSASLNTRDSVLFVAVPVDANGHAIGGLTIDWATDDEVIASISPMGLVRGNAPGSTFVTASVAGVSASAPVVISAREVSDFVVTVAPSLVTAAGVGDRVQFAATVTASDGFTVADPSIVWSSLDNAISTIDAGTGVATAVGVGSTTIFATIPDGSAGTATLVVPLPGSTAVASITLDPATINLFGEGDSGTLRATARAADGNAIAGKTFTWITSDADVATVDHVGVTTAVGLGSTVITATTEGVSGSAGLTVFERLDRIEVARVLDRFESRTGPTTLVLDASAQLEATVFDAAGTSVPVPVEWSSDDGAIVGVDETGEVTANGVGAASVAATIGDLEAQIAIEVVSASFETVGAGALSACGLVDAALFCWGTLTYGAFERERFLASPTTMGVGQFTDLSVGATHACTIAVDGLAWCWGADEDEALGNGTDWSSFKPVPVSGGIVFQEISAGRGVTCGISAPGALYCWGAYRPGPEAREPELVPGTPDVVTLSAGMRYGCALTVDGTAYCWGANDVGQLGNGTSVNSVDPEPVLGGHEFAAISASSTTTCGLLATGAAFCWGGNHDGEIGDGTTTDRTTPVAVLGGITFSQIDVGGRHTCGMTGDGLAYCWGWNGEGQLGNGSTDNSLAPSLVAGGLRFTSISAGGAVTCGVSVAGPTYCWGRNREGQLGNRMSDNALTPSEVTGFR